MLPPELIPFGHTLLFGVVKDYWTIIFGSSKKAKRGSRGRVQVAGLITSASKAVIASRASGLRKTGDFNRGYNNVLTQRGDLPDITHPSIAVESQCIP